MAEDSHPGPSTATLGYLAPICVAVFFLFVWIIVGTRHRYRHLPGTHPIDPENWPLGFPQSILSANALNSRFPLVKYGEWSADHGTGDNKEKGVDGVPSPAQPEPTCPPPLSRSFHNGEKEEDSHSLCAICMEYFFDPDFIRALDCGHIFHAACIDPWFTKRQARCPLCKTCYPPDPTSSSAPIPPAAALLRNQIFPRVL